MKSFSSLPLDARVIVLTDGTRVRDVADACRSAALAFAWSASLWGKRELAMWLVGPYARAVATANAMLSPASGVRRAPRPAFPIPRGAIARLVESAHVELLDSLRRAWSWRYDAGFARDMIDAGVVAGIVDDESSIGYAPIDRPDMRLVDRARSLFLADYLTRPRDYESFAVCPGCGAATFDLGRSHEGECAAERIAVPPSPAPPRLTLPWLGVDDAPKASADVLLRSFEIEPEVSVEVVGEIEIEVDTYGVDDEDVDAAGDLRDTIIDPIELASSF
jgi:hypothetical protein